MRPAPQLLFLPALALLISATVTAPSPAGAADLERTTLPSGMEVIHGRQTGSGMVAVAVLVRAGAAWETAATNGAAHFLEHLLFNGTETRTQAELYADIDRIGAYVNATTRRDHVAYLAVCAAEDLEQALVLLDDMLFHSTLPEDKFEKERGIIIEEIGKRRADVAYGVERAIDTAFGRGAEYARPILGSVDSIEKMQRDAVMSYYRRFYSPANMSVLILGEIDRDVALARVEQHLAAGDDAPARGERAVAPERPALVSQVTRIPLAVDDVTLAWRFAPLPTDSPDLPALQLLADWLGDEYGELQSRLTGEGLTDVAASVLVEEGRSFFEMQMRAAAGTDPRTVTGVVVDALESLAAEGPDPQRFESLRVKRLTADALAAEQMHYVAFMSAGTILHAPSRLFSRAPEVFGALTPADLAGAAARLLDRSAPSELVVAGAVAGDDVIQVDPRDWRSPRLAQGPTSRPTSRPSAGPATDAPATRDLAMLWEALDADVAPPLAGEPHAPRTVTLANGMTVVVSSNPDSPVFAVHLAARGRTFHEPGGKSGVADLLHRCVAKGAFPWTPDEFGQLLGRAGVQLKVTDSAFIPYDDYYTNQDFSFIRMQTVTTYYRQALTLLAHMVARPNLDEAIVEQVKRDAVYEAERRESRARERSRQRLREIQWAGSSGGRPALGSLQGIQAIEPEDVRAFQARYFHPANLVVTVVTNVDPDHMVSQLEATLGAIETTVPPVDTAATGLAEARLTRADARFAAGHGGAEQSWIRLGSVFAVDDAGRDALDVAVQLLSQRMAFELRERQGLAYSIGASVNFDDGRARLVAAMGTRPENLEGALESMTLAIHRFPEQPVTASEIVELVKKRTGRVRMRQITRMGQAFALSMDVLAGGDVESSRVRQDALLDVTPEDVTRVARRYLAELPLITVVAR